MDATTRRLLLVHGFIRELSQHIGFKQWIPESVMLLIATTFPELLIRSDVITTTEQEDALYDILCSRIGTSSSDRFELKRVFSTAIHGRKGCLFHDACDKSLCPTIMVARSRQYDRIFGGFSTVCWKAADDTGWTNKQCPTAFLFSFDKKGWNIAKREHSTHMNDHVFDVKIFDDATSIWAIRCNYQFGPCFGNGCDLFIGRNANNCYSAPSSFALPTTDALVGGSTFDIDIMEVFEVHCEH